MFFKRSSLLSMASRESGIANLLLAATTYELERLQEHSFSIARSAECRLARFLLDLAGRIANPIAIELQMSRQDIADYLGLTIETVSRSFTKLERAGMIARKGSRRIVLRNRAALQYVIG
jgi:CRP/FNR family nitrogen fixation transcriptional regulator